MFRPIAMVLAATLCLPTVEAAKPDPREAVLVIPAGASVRIKTIDKQTIEGRLGATTSESVTVQILAKDQIRERTVAFAEMKSIRQTNKPMSAGKAVLITLGVIYSIAYIIVGASGGF